MTGDPLANRGSSKDILLSIAALVPYLAFAALALGGFGLGGLLAGLTWAGGAWYGWKRGGRQWWCVWWLGWALYILFSQVQYGTLGLLYLAGLNEALAHYLSLFVWGIVFLLAARRYTPERSDVLMFAFFPTASEWSRINLSLWLSPDSPALVLLTIISFLTLALTPLFLLRMESASKRQTASLWAVGAQLGIGTISVGQSSPIYSLILAILFGMGLLMGARWVGTPPEAR